MKRTRITHPTLADVARLANVGKATVSRVINGGQKVSAETLARINEVIEELGYKPSQAARSLKGDGTRSIGLIIPSIKDPFFAGCAEAAQEIARSHGYLMIVTATNYDEETEISQLESLIRQRVEGILLAPMSPRNKALGSLVKGSGIPVVTLDHPLRTADVSSVLTTNRAGSRLATQHLLEHGYKNILCLGGDLRLYTIQERQKGYTDAMRAARLEPLIEASVNTYAEIESVLRDRSVRKRRVDAIFAVRNSITIFAFQAMQALGWKIPQHTALVGFDDFDLASTLRPGVTVVRQPIEKIGQDAARLLFDDLKGLPAAKRKVRNSLRTDLVIRASCGCR